MTPGMGIVRENVHDGSLVLYFDVARHRLYPFLCVMCAYRLDGLMGTGSNNTSDDKEAPSSSAPFFAGERSKCWHTCAAPCRPEPCSIYRVKFTSQVPFSRWSFW